MPYVSRNEQGQINGLYALPQPGYGEESLSEDDAEVVAFTSTWPESMRPKRAKLDAKG